MNEFEKGRELCREKFNRSTLGVRDVIRISNLYEEFDCLQREKDRLTESYLKAINDVSNRMNSIIMVLDSE